jgi:hypothetical protein
MRRRQWPAAAVEWAAWAFRETCHPPALPIDKGRLRAAFLSKHNIAALLHVGAITAYVLAGNPQEKNMADNDDMVPITATLSKSLYDALVKLATERGVSANTVLQQAITREKYLSDKESSGASVLIEEKDKSIKKITSR